MVFTEENCNELLKFTEEKCIISPRTYVNIMVGVTYAQKSN